MSAIEIVLAIVLGLAVNETCDLSPWAAKKVIRWAARRRYSDPARAEARAEELSALIDRRPGKLFKLGTALLFAANAVLSRLLKWRAMGRTSLRESATDINRAVDALAFRVAADQRNRKLAWRAPILPLSCKFEGFGDAEINLSEAFAGLPALRVVLLGEAGSGKTSSAIDFVLSCVQKRKPGEPVPVIFQARRWNPEKDSMSDWMAATLLSEHSDLNVRATSGVTLAQHLVNSGQIFPVLDGFDEIAPELQGAAVREINRAKGPLLLTSRTHNYETAIAAGIGGIDHATVAELSKLDRLSIAQYIAQCSRSEVWRPVIRSLRTKGDPFGEAVAQCLASPLTLALTCQLVDEFLIDPCDLLTGSREEFTVGLYQTYWSSRVCAAATIAAPDSCKHWRGRRGLRARLVRISWNVVAWHVSAVVWWRSQLAFFAMFILATVVAGRLLSYFGA